MKAIYAFITSIFSLATINTTVIGQCISPDLKFANPVLVSGTALQEGAIYKFPDISVGIDCYIKLVKLNGGAKLISMETPGQGYPDAWQPIIDGPGTPMNNKSWIDWDISFKTTAGDNYAFTCLDITAIDVDGDNGKIGEFVESDGHTNYTLPVPSILTITDMGSGRIEAQAPITNRPSIDTSAMDVRIGFLYNGKDKIQLKLGSKVYSNGGGGATQRLNCIYFKRIVLTNYIILPVKYISFEAVANKNQVDLKWVTENESNHSYFEVERSFDGSNFSSIAVVLDALNIKGDRKTYMMSDNSAVLAEKGMVYYRLKQVDVKGNFNYSYMVIVKLKTSKGVSVQVSPNPFKENLSIRFTALENASGTIRMISAAGHIAYTKSIIIKKGDNTLQVENLSSLSNGIYLAQVVVNGMVLDNQKVIKY